jgi:hypothetical protein
VSDTTQLPRPVPDERLVSTSSAHAARRLSAHGLGLLLMAAAARDPFPPPKREYPAAPGLRAQAAACSTELSPLRRAQDAEARAVSRMQSYPLAPSDGLLALELLTEAEHCFAAAVQPQSEQRVAAQLARFQHTLEAEYRAHQVRLLHALRSERTPDAIAESRALLAILGPHESAYTTWLRHVEKGQP